MISFVILLGQGGRIGKELTQLPDLLFVMADGSGVLAGTLLSLCWSSVHSHKRNSLIHTDDCPPFVAMNPETGEANLAELVCFLFCLL